MGMTEKYYIRTGLLSELFKTARTVFRAVKIAMGENYPFTGEGDGIEFSCDRRSDKRGAIAVTAHEKPGAAAIGSGKLGDVIKPVTEEENGFAIGMHRECFLHISDIAVRVGKA